MIKLFKDVFQNKEEGFIEVLKAELHTHCKEDPRDSRFITYSARELVDRAIEMGYDVLAITCHNYVFVDENLRSYALGHGLVLIFGVERDIENKHVLLFNVTQEEAMEIKTFKDLYLAREKKKDLFTIAAHPPYPVPSCLRGKIYKSPGLFDAWEHGSFHTWFYNPNKEMVRKARKFGKPVVGNSDVHLLKDLGRTYSLIDSEKNEEAIFAAIKDGRVRVVSEPVPVFEFFHIIFKVLVSTLRHKIRVFFAG